MINTISMPAGCFEGVLDQFQRYAERADWTPEKRGQVSEQMLECVEHAVPPGSDTVAVDQERWEGLANDLRAATTISPPQWASEIASTAVST